MVLEAKHLHISIDASPQDVYEFVVNPANLPQWAAGLSGSIKQVKGEWISESPMGPVKIAFVARNPFGVLDHMVTLPSGVSVNNPMRVLPSGKGSEFVFTLFRQPDTSDEAHRADIKAVTEDLIQLKRVLEHKVLHP